MRNMVRKTPIIIPENITVKIDKNQILVTGPKGNVSFKTRPEVKVKILEGGKLSVEKVIDTRLARMLYGTTRAIIANLIKGVLEGFKKTLVLSGTGYKAEIAGNKLFLSVGFSHRVELVAPPGIGVAVQEDKITISGVDKALVGEFASTIRRVKPPEPYKGKGIRFEDERIRRKVGKKALSSTA